MRAQAAAEVERARRRSIIKFCDVSTGLRGHGGSRRELTIKQRNEHHQERQPQAVVKGVRVRSASSNRAVVRQVRHCRPVSAPLHRRWLVAHERHLRADTARRKLEAWQNVEGAQVDGRKDTEGETGGFSFGLVVNDEDVERQRQALVELRQQLRIDAETQRERAAEEEELARAQQQADKLAAEAARAKTVAEAQAAAAATEAAAQLAAQEKQVAEQQRRLKASSRGRQLYPVFFIPVPLPLKLTTFFFSFVLWCSGAPPHVSRDGCQWFGNAIAAGDSAGSVQTVVRR